MFLILILLMSVVAVIHYIIKKKENDDEMKMTKQEVKEERRVRRFRVRLNQLSVKKAMELVMGQNLQNVSLQMLWLPTQPTSPLHLDMKKARIMLQLLLRKEKIYWPEE